MAATTVGYDSYLGRTCTGHIYSGQFLSGDSIPCCAVRMKKMMMSMLLNLPTARARCRRCPACLPTAAFSGCLSTTLLKAPVEGKWKSSLAKRELAGDAVLKMLSTGLSAGSFDYLRLSRTECVKEFKEQYFLKGIPTATDSVECKDASFVFKMAAETNKIVSKCVFGLFDHLNRHKAINDLDGELEEMFASKDQWKTNDDVREILAQEDADEEMETDEKLGDLMESKACKFMKPLDAEADQSKCQSKIFRRGNQQLSNARLNGHKKANTSTEPSTKSRRRKTQARRRRKGNPGGASKDGPGNSRRS